ncbi:hypothetical protein BJX99DRAFT_224231 [Aspergillus californicus]
MMQERDEVDSGASVAMNRSTIANAPGSAMNPGTRQVFEHHLPANGDLDSFGLEQDMQLLSCDEVGKEMLVIVKRGKHANIIEPKGPPYEPGQDIREWAGEASWVDIKNLYESQLIMYGDSSPLITPARREHIVLDQYANPDEYTSVL